MNTSNNSKIPTQLKYVQNCSMIADCYLKLPIGGLDTDWNLLSVKMYVIFTSYIMYIAIKMFGVRNIFENK